MNKNVPPSFSSLVLVLENRPGIEDEDEGRGRGRNGYRADVPPRAFISGINNKGSPPAMNPITDGELLDALEQAIRRGKPMTVPVSGVSMGAGFAAVDAVGVAPAPAPALRAGMIVVYRRENKWVGHRVVRVLRNAGDRLCVTKGDGVNRLDHPPVSRQEYIGVVMAVQSGSRTRALTFRDRVYGLWQVGWGLARVAASALFSAHSPAR